MNANSNQPATAKAAKTNQYIARKTADACGIFRNSILCDGALIADCLLASDASALAAKLNEHAALIAVAEAAGNYYKDKNWANDLLLESALTNLAAIRSQNGGGK
jgi:hypothetical protein